MKNLDLEIKAIGLMSGTSCDGLDIAYCHFRRHAEKWGYDIVASETLEYDRMLLEQLQNAASMTGLELLSLDRSFGTFCGKAVKGFIEKRGLTAPDIIGSHGHTVFHTPPTGLTYQLGSGASLHAACGIPVACDFRSVDVALGGQGAPLVPMGDRLLFSEYDYCLNLGGISNISYAEGNTTIAFDICPVNMILNYLAGQVGMVYDKDGAIAASGTVDDKLLIKLNQLDFYRQHAPKSLGKEWFEDHFLPLIQQEQALGIPNLLATCVEHIAEQMAKVITGNNKQGQRLLATGGGAFNTHLMECFAAKLKGACTIEWVDAQTIAFKEALIFALLGVLRYTGENNVFSSATGSAKDHCGGALYGIG
jgi:anhydro-N-acetylmuramic acid kinase